MHLFRKKETAIQNIAFIAMMASINALAALLSSFVPLSSIFVVLFLPLLSALSVKLIKKRFIPLYMLASISISIIAGLYDASNVIFYLIPAILAGSSYGLLSELGFPLGVLIFSVSLLGMGLNYLALPVLKAVYGVDFIDYALGLLNISSKPHVRELLPAFILSLSIAETSLSNLLIQISFEKIKIARDENGISKIFYPIMGVIFSIMALSIGFASLSMGALSMICALYFGALSIHSLFEYKKWWLFSLVLLLFLASFMLYALLYERFPEGGKLFLIGFYTFSVAFPSLLGRILLIGKRRKARQ